MKKSITAFVIICAAATAGLAFYQHKQKVLPVPAPVVESSPGQAAPPPKIVGSQQGQPQLATSSADRPILAASPAPTASDLKPEKTSPPHSRAVDTLVSTQTSFNDRWALLKQLKKKGELGAAIVELQQRAIDDPNDAMIQTALGEALMSKFPIQDYNEQAMLGLQINQNFDAALKLDPASWEAQYSKADALSGWPPQMNTGPEVVQQLSGLIDQQETMTPQPQFVDTYVLLGEEYQKLGQPDKAAVTWQLGLQKFPNNPTLQARLANVGGQ